jgi:hypothetical protein
MVTHISPYSFWHFSNSSSTPESSQVGKFLIFTTECSLWSVRQEQKLLDIAEKILGTILFLISLPIARNLRKYKTFERKLQLGRATATQCTFTLFPILTNKHLCSWGPRVLSVCLHVRMFFLSEFFNEQTDFYEIWCEHYDTGHPQLRVF